MELFLEVGFRILPGLISMLVLYILNKIFKYKDKIIRIIGALKYKLAVSAIVAAAYYILVYKYNLSSRSPIVTVLMFSLIYLLAVNIEYSE